MKIQIQIKWNKAVMRTGLLSLFVLASCMSVLAQAVSLPYFCGFEDPLENANWTFRKGTNFGNQWVIGSAVANYGNNSLYISHNNGTSAEYTNSKGSAISYRTFNLPQGTYQVDFDWMALGNGTDVMYVAWMTSQTEIVDLWATDNNGAGSGVKMYSKPWQSIVANGVTQRDTIMSSYATWQHGSFEVNSSGNPVKLVFFWTNSQTKANNPGGCKIGRAHV